MRDNGKACPICSKSGVWKEGVKECPQCGSNLDVLADVCDLPEAKKEHWESGKRRLEEWVTKFSLVLVSVLVLVMLVSMGMFAYLYHRQMQSNLASLHQSNQLLVSELKSVGEDLTPVNIRMSAPRRHQRREKIHILKKGESLQGVARQYWGEEIYYPLLLEYNMGVSLLARQIDLQIKVPLDKDQVERDYQRFVIKLPNGTFLRYLVRGEDTWQGIAEYLWGEGADILLLKKLNSFQLIPGERVLVPWGE